MTDRAETAEEAVDRHGPIIRRWAREDTRRGRLARSILRVAEDDSDGRRAAE